MQAGVPSQQLFGIIIPGREVITNFVPADPSLTKFTLTVPFLVQTDNEASIASISDIVFFLLPNIALPPNSGAMIYWSASSNQDTTPSSFELLGALTPTQPSTILRTGWSTNEPLHHLIQSLMSSNRSNSNISKTINITFGVSIESLDNINNLNVTHKNDNECKNVAQKIALDLFNYLQSFDDTQQNAKGWMNVPTNVFDRWFKRFEMKIARDPNFFMKNSKE